MTRLGLPELDRAPAPTAGRPARQAPAVLAPWTAAARRRLVGADVLVATTAWSFVLGARPGLRALWLAAPAVAAMLAWLVVHSAYASASRAGSRRGAALLYEGAAASAVAVAVVPHGPRVDGRTLVLGALLAGVATHLARRGLTSRVPEGPEVIDLRDATLDEVRRTGDMALLVPGSRHRVQAVAKRTVDVVGAATMLVLASPAFLLVALVVKAGDRGPVLFRQERVGRHGEPFTMLKFRTMVVDAEARRAELAATNARTGPLFKAAGDPRVTRVGRPLRASSLDELPQLWNVLRGEMSLVGPRPALRDEIALFPTELLRRHEVLPGITGLWQVKGRDDADFAIYIENDLYYVDNWTVGLDLTILARTAVVVASRAARTVGPGRRRGDAVVLD